MKSKLMIAGVAVTGALVGASVISLATDQTPLNSADARNLPRVRAAEERKGEGNREVGADERNELSELRARIRQLENQADAAVFVERSPSVAAPATSNGARPLTPQEEIDAEKSEWSERSQSFENEVRESSWAGRAEAKISQGLAPLLAKLAGELQSVSCRATRCRVELAWSGGLGDVSARSMHALHESHQALNCARSVRVADDRASSTLIFECSDPEAALAPTSDSD